jgi:hypothetical protein
MAAIDTAREHARQLQDVTGIAVDVVDDGGRILVLLHGVPLPPGIFQVDSSEVLFICDKQYPLSKLDMFWTDLDVLRRDGSVPANGDSIEQYGGRAWRRFSWHSNTHNPAGNCLLDHFALMEARLAEEADR